MGRQKLSNSQERKRKLSHDLDKVLSEDEEDGGQTEVEDEEQEQEPIKSGRRLVKQSVTSIDVDTDGDSSPSPKPSQPEQPTEAPRPKRKATNAHFFRYLQTRNPSRLEEEDLRRALEASLEECPDYWPEDSASCSSSDHSNAPSSTSGCSTSGGDSAGHCNVRNCKFNNRLKRRRSSSQLRCSRSTTQFCPQQTINHSPCNHHCHNSQNSYPNHPATNCHCHSHPAVNNNLFTHQCCPYASVHRRYKPVAKKNIYDEADFFHDGIMEYIEYELMKHEGVIGT